MNIEEIQSQWENEHTSKVMIPESLLHVKTANLHRNRIQKILKREAIIQIFAFIILALWPVWFHFKPPYLQAFYVLFFSFLLLSVYQIFKLLTLFKRVSGNTLNSQHHLYQLYYDVNLMMEQYKSWTYLAVPFAIIFALIHRAHLGHDLVRILTTSELTGIVAALLIVVPVKEIYIRVVYGKYIRQIKQLIDQLNEV